MEVTNEVYQTELVRWLGDMEQCEQTAVETDNKCKVESDAEQKVLSWTKLITQLDHLREH